MKTILTVCLAALTAAAAFAADALPAFNATLTVGKESRFVLIGADGKASSFLQIGDSFDGYKIKAYDAKAAALDLEKDGKVSRVTLAADAAVAEGGMAAMITKATVEDATAVLDAMHFEDMLDKTMAGMRKQQLAMVDQMLSRMGGPTGPEREEAVAFQKKIMDEMMSAISGAELKGDVAKAYSEIFTKAELQGLASFYSSPLGQTFSDKQPILAQKMNEVIMPRMMAVMPKIQRMSQEFAMQQKAKRDAAKAAQQPAPAPAPSAPTPTP